MSTRFYVTTPIYYINDVPHLGSAYTTIAADIICRYHRIRGHESRFLTGTDEHGLKIQRAAEERGIAPIALADQVTTTFRATWPQLGCMPDDFIRTSETRHKKRAQFLWSKIDSNGDIYLGHYEGMYCVGCEAYYTEKDLQQPGNICPLHGKPAERVKEESYFFRLSKYTDPLLDYYKQNPTFVQPATRLNEVTSFVKEGLQDLSVSRTTFQWGIPVPNDPKHVMYVWFDALANYLTALFEPEDATRFWPANIHLVGKDILRFHAVYWPAFLLSAGYPMDQLPRQVYAHGFLTYNGQKMSKTLRNTISPVALATAISPTVGVDTLRYCLMRSISFGQDGDFSIHDVLSRYASDLGNALGNLLNRVLPFATEVPEKGPLGPLEDELLSAYQSGAANAASAFDLTHLTKALDAIWTIIAAANLYVDKAAPWAAKKSDPQRLATIIAVLVEVLEAISIMIAPVMPNVADMLRSQLGRKPLSTQIDHDQWPFSLPTSVVGQPLQKGSPIFPRMDKEREAQLIHQFSISKEADTPPQQPPTSTPQSAETKPLVSFEDFAKLDLRVGVVVSAERVKKKDKLLQLRVDTGDESPRTLIAGIASHYAPEQLIGKRIVVICNLKPKDFGKGLVSQGMLLAANAPDNKLWVISVDTDSPPGAQVR